MFQGAYLLAQVDKGLIPDIYVQDEKYFTNVREEVRLMYSQDIPAPVDMVAIHVRRAGNPINPDEPNYSDNPFMVNLCDTYYYQDAMALFPKEQFLVFSDDIEWCRKQDMFAGCEFYHGTELEDMNLMAACKGIIMANSSFSWWSAYLSNGKVVAPKQYYADGKQRTKLLDSWIQI